VTGARGQQPFETIQLGREATPGEGVQDIAAPATGRHLDRGPVPRPRRTALRTGGDRQRIRAVLEQEFDDGEIVVAEDGVVQRRLPPARLLVRRRRARSH
jgi:hypothetical protein